MSGEKRNKLGRTPLMAACCADKLDTARRLIARGAEVNAKTLPDEDELEGVFAGYAIVSGGESALMLAARLASVAMVRLLVEAGADLQHMDAQNDTALSNSVGARDAVAKIRYLVGKGAKTDRKGANAALYVAASEGKTSIVRLLLQLGAKVDGKVWFGNTALTAAAQYGHVDAFRLLLDAGADVNARGQDGTTPLHQAAAAQRDSITVPLKQRLKLRKAYGEMTALLIEAGAKVDARDKDGNTPLILACHNDQETSTRLLLERAKPNVRLRNAKKNTALIEAVNMNAMGPLRHLLLHGASLEDRDANGAGPLAIAEGNDYEEMVKVLKAATADKSDAPLSLDDIQAIYALGDYKRALAGYDALPKKDTQLFAVLSNSAYCLQQLRKHREAVVRFSAALKQHPEKQHLYGALCFSLWATKSWAEMAKVAKRGVTRDPRDAYCWQQLGIAHIELKDYASAVDVLEKALTLDPGDETVKENLAKARKKVKR